MDSKKENINNKIRVSIGMPVFNGEKFIRNALDSIIKQTYGHFEIIISDNASTDQTQSICLEYASRDSRIRYYRNEINIGGPKNYNRVFELASSEYFKWAAYDDVIAPEFLERCISILDSDQTIIGCFCKTGRIDENGGFLGYHNINALKRVGSYKVQERFRDLLGMYYITTPFHGVYRSNLFGKTQRHGSYIGADRNLVAELSLLGRIYEIPQCLFYWREHSRSYTSMFYGRVRDNSLDRLQKEIAWWSKDGGTNFPHWKNCLEYFRSLHRIPLTLPKRMACYVQIFDWLLREGRRFLAKDILLFLVQHSSIATNVIKSSSFLFKPKIVSKLGFLIEVDQ
jgi:glycosyltransferase involved in cell wall biosynthesis